MRTKHHNVLAAVAAALAIGLAACGGSGPDTNPPKVQSTDPASGAAGVPFDAKIQIVFDEAIDRNTLSSDLFHLVLAGVSHYGNVSYDLTHYQATLSMTSPLEAGASYQAVLEPGVKDLAGNRMGQAYSWSFTVGN